jgi:hypothetical protein
MSDGKIFSRLCPVCGVRHQTADQTGVTPCSEKCVVDGEKALKAREARKVEKAKEKEKAKATPTPAPALAAAITVTGEKG